MNAAACIAPAAWLLAILALLIVLGLVATAVILYLARKTRRESLAEFEGVPLQLRRVRAGQPPADDGFSFSVFDQRPRTHRKPQQAPGYPQHDEWSRQ